MKASTFRYGLDANEVEQLLVQIALAGDAVSYSGLLLLLGHHFTRPKMRVLCQVLDEIDERRCDLGAMPLAAFVVRKSDQLPGQGWWACRTDYVGPTDGREARRYLKAVQQAITASLCAEPAGETP